MMLRDESTRPESPPLRYVVWLVTGPSMKAQELPAYDLSGNNNIGSLVNSPTWVTGKFGKALQFNGINQYVSATAVSLTEDFAISLWFKLSSSVANQRIMANFQSGLNAAGWYLFENGGANAYKFAFQNGAASVEFPNFGTIDTTTFHNIVVSRSGSIITLYFDVVSKGTQTLNGTVSQ